MAQAFLPYSDDARDAAAQRFVDWLAQHVVSTASGADGASSPRDPSDRLWLGRLAPAAVAGISGLDSRMERLEPCEIGVKVRPVGKAPWSFTAQVQLTVWQKVYKIWNKQAIDLGQITAQANAGQMQAVARQELTRRLREKTGCNGFSGELQCGSQRDWRGHDVLTISFVNTSDEGACKPFDARFYEAVLTVTGLQTSAFELESLEESFRFDRLVPAYGVNCGVCQTGGTFTTSDTPSFDRARPDFWGGSAPQPNLSFQAVARDAVIAADAVVAAHADWGRDHWSASRLDDRAKRESWDASMRAAADAAAKAFWEENQRLSAGAALLKSNAMVSKAFGLMNEAMVLVGSRKGYDGWRPFQFGFLLANIVSLIDNDAEPDTVDIVWFATGGGKTETYLGLLVTASFHDRLRGKAAGITAWSRFPLRLLSLQQMQRFADAMAAAEIVRRRNALNGAPFSVGFLVGDDATPNRWRRPDQDKNVRYDPDDKSLVNRFRMLQCCPFCGNTELKMGFDFGRWTYEHRCGANGCSWPERGLPFHIVDEEVFRFLPTVVVGTLDKAASIGIQQAMRGLVASPRGQCPKLGHGFTYNTSSKSQFGCLVPDCNTAPTGLPCDAHLFAPSYRLQDELHLLRDSLGAVDGHYEAALDGLQLATSGRRPKILASSATLSGYSKQSEVLYRRAARVFPHAPPDLKVGFWTRPGGKRMRRFTALAPRGATIEFAVDRLMAELQIAVRKLWRDPVAVCGQLDIDPKFADFLLDQYGTTTVYGNTLRDLDAVARSATTQLVGVEGNVRSVSLTGRTQFDQISGILDDLQKGDSNRPFDERIHLITASSMMSHGVDVDRLNVMIVLGVPLTTAEFIQATARVGRRWPAIVLVVHKMGRERDAGVFRLFEKFVEHGDRFVEPIPITKRSRRVLERTVPGVEGARLLHLHAASSQDRLTTVAALRKRMQAGGWSSADEAEAINTWLALDPTTEAEHRKDVEEMLSLYQDRVNRATTKATEWPVKLWPKNRQPMTSLRDVEEQVAVHLRRD